MDKLEQILAQVQKEKDTAIATQGGSDSEMYFSEGLIYAYGEIIEMMEKVINEG